MTMRSTKTLSAAALAAGIALFAGVDGAQAFFGCPPSVCGDNGTLISGLRCSTRRNPSSRRYSAVRREGLSALKSRLC